MPGFVSPEVTRGSEAPKKQPAPTTRLKMREEDWKTFIHALHRSGIYEGIEKFKVNEVDIDDNDKKGGFDTLQKILEAIFLDTDKLGLDRKAAQPMINSILAGLKADGVEDKADEKFVDKIGANRWGFTNGKIKFMKHEGGTYKTIAFLEVFPPVTYEVVGTQKYKLGVGHIPESEDRAKELSDEKVDILKGTVDATAFTREKRSDAWYGDKINLAKFLLNLYDRQKQRFDAKTQQWIKDNEDVLRDMVENPYTDVGQMRNSEDRHPYEKVFGAKGIYNLLLAFKRVLNSQGTEHVQYDALNKSNARIVLRVDEGGRRSTTGYTIKPKEEPPAKAA